MADNRVQLIIEAFNRTQTAWTELSGQVDKAKAQAVTLYDAYGKPVQALDKMAAAGTEAGNVLDAAGKKGSQGINQIHDSARQSYSMLGQMVQMAVIYGSLRLGEKLVSEGIDYNKTLETSKLGIAAIMTSMGVITNAQGEVLQGQDKWNAAQGLTVDAQKELQRIAIATPATYKEVVQAYQGLLAPSLGAKLNFKDTLELAGLLTNSIKAMGLPANQIVQEGRDLVAGTIDQNSQLARSLQISNEDVKKWREKGTVFQEIKGRLAGFAYASREFENTWEGAWSNFKDYAQKALGEGSKSPFEFLKQEMIRISNEMVNITKDANGKVIDVQVKPEVAARIRELSEELNKLIKFMESAISWGSKLAEPAMYIAIAVGIGKITTAVRELSFASKSINASLIGALITSQIILGKAVYDAHDATDTSDVAKRYKTAGGKDDLSWIGPQKLSDLKNQHGMDNESVARALKAGVLKQSQEPNDNIYGWSDFNFNETSLKKFMAGGTSTDQLAGSGKKTAEELKKAREAALADLADSYAEADGIFKVGEARETETIKTGLKEKELAYQQGLITQEEYIKARADLQRQGLTAELNAISDQQAKLTKKYSQEAAAIEDPKELSEKHKAYVTEWYKLEADYEKKKAELKRTGIEEDLKNTEERRKLQAVERDGALKLLQERLNGEKELNQILLERGRITPLEAERRNIANENAGLEAEYWKVFGEKQSALTKDNITAKENELQVLEQRMANFDAKIPLRLKKADLDTNAKEFQKREAEINHQLAQLDEAEKFRDVSRIDALSRRKDLLEEILHLQESDLAAIDKAANPQAWLAQQTAIDGTRKSLLELQLQARDLSDDMAKGFREGLMQYVDETGGPFKRMVDMARSTAAAMESSFSDFFFDAMTGKLKSFGDYITSFLNSVARAMATMMAQTTAQGLVGQIVGLFSTGGGSVMYNGAGSGGDLDSGLFDTSGMVIKHDGGIMVPRFHFGGLASDEVPAVLLTKERVLSREQNILFENFVKKTDGSGSAPNVAVNIINQTGQPMTARQSGSPRFDAGQWVVDVVADNITNHGVLGQMLAR